MSRSDPAAEWFGGRGDPSVELEADLGCLTVDELDALGGQSIGERGRGELDLDLDERAVRRLFHGELAQTGPAPA